MSELAHYGIESMHWGVRRYQNPDGTLTEAGRERYGSAVNVKRLNKQIKNKGIRDDSLRGAHTIPKGTVIYRTTSVKNENDSGTTYVSYLDVDRQHYNGGWIREVGGTGKAYEHTYVLNEDLNVPSRETASKVVNDVMNENRKLVNETVNNWLNITVPENSYGRYSIITSLGGEEAYENDAKREKVWKNYVNEAVKHYGNMTADEAAFYTMQTFGTNTKVRDKVTNRLKEMGYNAMTDEASVGGRGSWAKEGGDPIIIFDRTGMLSEKKVKTVSSSSERKADQRYRTIINKARRKTTGEWSIPYDDGLYGLKDGLEDDNFLEHHGIKGMRWGVRRYQNPDGTLTTAGKLRYRMADGSPRELTTSAKLKKHLQDLQRRHLEKVKARKEERAEKKEERKVEKAAEDRARRIEEAKNDPEKMTRLSDDELREVINRINLETQYMNARDKAMEGRRFVDKLISGTGKAVSLTTNVANIAGNLANLKEKWNKFTGNDDPNRDLKERSEKLRLLNEINDFTSKLDPKNRKAREEAEALAADVKKAEGEAKIAEFKNKKEALEKKLPQGNDVRKQQGKIENGAKTVERVLAEAGKKKDTKQDNNQKPSEPHVNKADEYIRNSQPGRLTGKESTPAKSEPRVNKADEYIRNSQPGRLTGKKKAETRTNRADEYIRNSQPGRLTGKESTPTKSESKPNKADEYIRSSQPGRLTGKESTPVKSEPRTNKADYYIKNVSDNKAKAADADRRLNQAIADDIEQRRRRIEEERKRKKK